MGYRSDVTVLVYAASDEDYNKLRLLMNTTYKQVLTDWEDDCTWVDSYSALKFVIEDVKWYPSYKDVFEFENFRREIETLGYAVEFIRVGEDYTDIETYESDKALGYLSVHRTIVSDV